MVASEVVICLRVPKRRENSSLAEGLSAFKKDCPTELVSWLFRTGFLLRRTRSCKPVGHSQKGNWNKRAYFHDHNAAVYIFSSPKDIKPALGNIKDWNNDE
jgi:hypothetical protein